MIKYQNTLHGITYQMLNGGFFVEWGEFYPSSEKHLAILQNSAYMVLAIDDEINKVVGFINSVSDKHLSAYIPLLEVLPSYQMKGIGVELVKRLMEQLKDFYMIDLTCDKRHISFYEKFGMIKSNTVMIRNYNKKGGI